MRIAIVSAVFPPEPVVSAQTSAQIANELVRHGHDVTVITDFPNRPAGRLQAGYRRQLFRRESTTDGYELVRCFTTLAPESRMTKRLVENLSYGLTSGWAVLTTRRPDVIYANSWPIVATGILASIARLRRIPLIISVQDAYPESIVAQRRSGPDGILVRCMRYVDKQIARTCHAVIVVADSFVPMYLKERGLSPERVHMIPNWVDSAVVTPDADGATSFRARLGIPATASVALYGGNIGIAAGVETVVESFRGLLDVPDLYLVIAGEGSQLGTCRELAQQLNHPRIVFHTPWPNTETSVVLSAADVLILPTRGQQSLASIPSKLITYMLAARPIIALALPGSDLAATIERSRCGWWLEPDQPTQLAECIKAVTSLSLDERRGYGESGREYALQNLSRAICLPRIVNLIEGAASARE